MTACRVLNGVCLSLTHDHDARGELKRVICQGCVEWKALDELHTDAEGQRWDVCQDCVAQGRV